MIFFLCYFKCFLWFNLLSGIENIYHYYFLRFIVAFLCFIQAGESRWDIPHDLDLFYCINVFHQKQKFFKNKSKLSKTKLLSFIDSSRLKWYLLRSDLKSVLIISCVFLLIMLFIFVGVYDFCIITLWMHWLFIIIIFCWHKFNFHFQMNFVLTWFIISSFIILPEYCLCKRLIEIFSSPLLLCLMYLSINAPLFFPGS